MKACEDSGGRAGGRAGGEGRVAGEEDAPRSGPAPRGVRGDWFKHARIKFPHINASGAGQ